MRTYLIHYYAEINDQCVDCEKKIEAVDIEDAILRFKLKIRLYKRITKIEEI